MNKIEFLEILKDYLKKDFSQDDINDILRDYEEYFVDGIIEGKSDMEIISALGSPKLIANELISQIKDNSKKEVKNSEKFSDKYNVFKLRAKENYNNIKKYVSEKLTPNIQNDNHNTSRKIIQIVLILLSLMLIIPAFSIIMTLVGIGVALVLSLVAFLGTIPIAVSFIKSTPQIMCIYIFASIAFIGGQILSWQIYIFIVTIIKKIIKSYINWIKTRNIYINASKKKEEYDNKEINNYEKQDDIGYKEKEGEDRYE